MRIIHSVDSIRIGIEAVTITSTSSGISVLSRLIAEDRYDILIEWNAMNNHSIQSDVRLMRGGERRGGEIGLDSYEMKRKEE